MRMTMRLLLLIVLLLLLLKCLFAIFLIIKTQANLIFCPFSRSDHLVKQTRQISPLQRPFFFADQPHIPCCPFLALPPSCAVFDALHSPSPYRIRNNSLTNDLGHFEALRPHVNIPRQRRRCAITNHLSTPLSVTNKVRWIRMLLLIIIVNETTVKSHPSAAAAAAILSHDPPPPPAPPSKTRPTAQEF